MTTSSTQLLQFYLYSMSDYERITDELKVSESLRRYDQTSRTASAALDSFQTDSAAIDVRLMLQRKYFQKKDGLFLRKLLDAARIDGSIPGTDIDDFETQINAVHGQPIELVLSDGTTISTQFKNAEKAVYSTLLHGDYERTLEMLAMPREMRLLSLAPYVLAREKLLFDFRDMCADAGINTLSAREERAAAVMRQERRGGDSPRISGSPFWSNLLGRDATEADIEALFANTSPDDKEALQTAIEFFELLRNSPLDTKFLKQMVYRKRGWGDFNQAAYIARSVNKPGYSSKVRHEGGKDIAQVRVFPNTEKPWMTSTPQLVSNAGCTIHLAKRKSVWKIQAIEM